MIHIRKRVVWLMIAAPAAVFSAPLVHVSLSPSGTITINGTSTLHNFECSSKVIEGTIDADPAERSFASAEISIPVRSIHSDNTSMDNNMYEALKASEFPAIHFSLTGPDSVRLLKPSVADTVIHLRGNLSIAGKQRPIELPVTVLWSDAGTIVIRGTQKLLMTDFGIDPPTFMLGVLKTGNEVTVEYSIELKDNRLQPHAVQHK